MFYVRIVVKCIVEDKGKILLIKESIQSSWKPGKWSLPGGKIDPRETFLDAITREMKEETGLQVKPQKIFSIYELVAKIKDEEERLLHHYIIVCQRTGGKIKKPDHHVGELKFFSPDLISKIKTEDFTEFYYKKLFKEFYSSKTSVIPISFVNILNCYKNKKYKAWLTK